MIEISYLQSPVMQFQQGVSSAAHFSPFVVLSSNKRLLQPQRGSFICYHDVPHLVPQFEGLLTLCLGGS